MQKFHPGSASWGGIASLSPQTTALPFAFQHLGMEKLKGRPPSSFWSLLLGQTPAAVPGLFPLARSLQEPW